MAWLSGFGRRRLVTVATSGKFSADVTDSPFYVEADSTWTGYWGNSPVDGKEVQFTLSDGTTLIPFDLDEYNSTNQTAVWSILTTLPSASDLQVYIYYKPTTAPADNTSRSTVWAAQNYNGVFHLSKDNPDGQFSDSSGNALTGAGRGTTSPSDQTGQIGRGSGFDGVDQRVEVSDNDLLSFGNGTNDSSFTIEAWINPSSNDRMRILGKFVTSPSTIREYTFSTASDGTLFLSLYDNSVNVVRTFQTSTALTLPVNTLSLIHI